MTEQNRKEQEPPITDDGDRTESKISNNKSAASKGTETPEVEVVNRQEAPKASIKIERKINLGDYNSATAQVFLSSGTLEDYRGELLNEDGEMREEVRQKLNSVVAGLQRVARNRMVDELDKQRNITIDASGHEPERVEDE